MNAAPLLATPVVLQQVTHLAGWEAAAIVVNVIVLLLLFAGAAYVAFGGRFSQLIDRVINEL